MCLAIPGRVKAIFDERGTRMARIDFGGIVKEACLEFVPELVVGDYTIVHVGFALSRIDEVSALETLEHFRAIGALEEELGEQSGPSSESFEEGGRR